MEAVRRIQCLVALSALLGAGCGANHDASVSASAVDEVEPSGNSDAVLLDTGEDQESFPDSNPARRAGPSATAAPTPPLGQTSSFDAPPTPSATTPTVSLVLANPTADPVSAPRPASAAALLREANNSPFHVFGDDVYTWDVDRQIVILRVPVGHESFPGIREQLGLPYGTIEDAPGTRSWIEQCARHYTKDARDAPAAVFGAISAQGVHSCLVGLVHLSDLFARYWWTESGVACLANTVSASARHSDDRIRPLALCPSIGYDPTAPQPEGWLKQRCEEIVAANPNSGYPTDSTGTYLTTDPLPSCWAPLMEIIGIHAAEGTEIGLPDSPHHCYHAFLGYVWARQTGRESRPPSDLAVGCHYRAFEVMP